ncbi:FMN-binding protein [Eubacteriaceae bacterium ES3]|nr:FMN-binding protein [Eubacteriaceae bacterium ES3]
MSILINVMAAWIAVVLAVLLSVVYILRIVNKGKGKDTFIGQLNRKLRNVHKPMGILFVIVACIHGFFSSGAVFSLNFGSFCMVTGILLGLTYWLRKAYKGQCSWCKPHRVLTVVLLVFLGIHLWEVGGIMGPEAFVMAFSNELEAEVQNIYGSEDDQPTVDETTTDEKETATASEDTTLSDSTVDQTIEEVNQNLFIGTADIADGTYTGVADGYGPDLTVSVTVSDNQITSVEVVSHNEHGEKYYGRAIDAVPASIVANQTPYVDAISGATYTSNGIMNAVVDALQQGLVSGSI